MLVHRRQLICKNRRCVPLTVIVSLAGGLLPLKRTKQEKFAMAGLGVEKVSLLLFFLAGAPWMVNSHIFCVFSR
jgi:hypothetical protein